MKSLAIVVLLLTAAALARADDLDLRRLLIDVEMTPIAAVAPPPLTLPDLNDQPVALASFKDRAVLVYFWATW